MVGKQSVMDLPFLYQTRTILRSASRPLPKRLPSRSLSQSLAQKQEGPVGNVDSSSSSFFRRKAAAVAANYAHESPNTITREEKRAFDELKKFAGRQELNARLGIVSAEPDRLDVDPDRILALFTPRQQQPQPDDDLEPSPTDPSSQTAASTNSTSSLATESLTHQVCTAEMHAFSRAATDILNAKRGPHDLLLYTLIEERVFPLLDILATQSRSRKPNKQQLKINNTTPSTTTKPSWTPPPRIPSPQSTSLTRLLTTHLPASLQYTKLPPLPLLTRLYPALLLLSIRLLTKHEPLSLHTHRLLPQIRLLGPSSYILGATTPFYNTHLLLRWTVYSSLSEVCDLLAEMERGAVEFDQGTNLFLRSLAEARAKALGTDRGGFRCGDWWMASEQVRWWGKVEEWRSVIARQLEEKGLGEVMREGPEGADLVGVSSRAEGQPQVWL